MAEDDICKTAITTPFGLFEFTKMPFGLRNVAQTFQRFIDEVTRGLDFVYTYVDDLIIANAAEHGHHLHQLLERFLQQYGVVINPAKFVFGVATLQFLEHTVTRHGIQQVESKVQAIRDFPPPPSLTKLQEFLGLVNFYRRFIHKSSHIVRSLTDMPGSTGPAKTRNTLLVLPPIMPLTTPKPPLAMPPYCAILSQSHHFVS